LKTPFLKKEEQHCTVLGPYSKVLIDISLSVPKVSENSAAALYQWSAGLGFKEKSFLFFIANKRRLKIYWEGIVRMPSLTNSFLHESLGPRPVRILIALFCNKNTFKLADD
jgi:hypothetical protein